MTESEAHKLAELDDSGFTSVAVCRCGISFLGVGEDRRQRAMFQWACHRFEYVEAVRTLKGGKYNPAPVWADYEHRQVKARKWRDAA